MGSWNEGPRKSVFLVLVGSIPSDAGSGANLDRAPAPTCNLKQVIKSGTSGLLLVLRSAEHQCGTNSFEVGGEGRILGIVP